MALWLDDRHGCQSESLPTASLVLAPRSSLSSAAAGMTRPTGPRFGIAGALAAFLHHRAAAAMIPHPRRLCHDCISAPVAVGLSDRSPSVRPPGDTLSSRTSGYSPPPGRGAPRRDHRRLPSHRHASSPVTTSRPPPTRPAPPPTTTAPRPATRALSRPPAPRGCSTPCSPKTSSTSVSALYMHDRDRHRRACARSFRSSTTGTLTHRRHRDPAAVHHLGEHARRCRCRPPTPSRFPEVVDVMVRILTDEGARLIAAYEASHVHARGQRAAHRRQRPAILVAARARACSRSLHAPHRHPHAQPL